MISKRPYRGRVFFVNKARNLYFRLVDGALGFYYNGTN